MSLVTLKYLKILLMCRVKREESEATVEIKILAMGKKEKDNTTLITVCKI